jgi:hypothetical protein
MVAFQRVQQLSVNWLPGVGEHILGLITAVDDLH